MRLNSEIRKLVDPKRNLRLKYKGPHVKHLSWNEKHTWSEKKYIWNQGTQKWIHKIEIRKIGGSVLADDITWVADGMASGEGQRAVSI